jgi:HSP20 family protein
MFRRGTPALRRRSTPVRQRPGDIFDVMESMFNWPMEEFGFGQTEFPAINMKEGDNEVTVQAELPGMEAKDLDISVQNGNLILQGEKKFEDEENRQDYQRVERAYGSFYRVLPLPTEVDEDKVKASFKKGVLEVRMPKTASRQGKKIEIESS